MPELVSWLQRWLYDVLSVKLSGTIRYYPRYKKQLGALAVRVEVSNLLQEIKSVNERRAIADHPLAPKLFIEDMLLDYSTLFS
jgi:DNA polymerase-3 subunit delta'